MRGFAASADKESHNKQQDIFAAQQSSLALIHETMYADANIDETQKHLSFFPPQSWDTQSAAATAITKTNNTRGADSKQIRLSSKQLQDN